MAVTLTKRDAPTGKVAPPPAREMEEIDGGPVTVTPTDGDDTL